MTTLPAPMKGLPWSRQVWVRRLVSSKALQRGLVSRTPPVASLQKVLPWKRMADSFGNLLPCVTDSRSGNVLQVLARGVVATFFRHK